MAPKLTPRGLQDIIPGISLDPQEPASTGPASNLGRIQRRGRDAVLEANDVDIVVYELFPDRA